MIISTRGNHNGFYSTAASGSLGNLRPIDHDIGIVNVLRSSVLHTLGRRLDKSSNTCYIRTIRLLSNNSQGEK